MRCCVPFCKNASDHVSTSEGNGISFYDFPSEVHLRAAWLRALGKQDSHLPDSAVVCSQHFLNDDIYETESGLRQIVTGAIPSTVQVCMICLDTDSKLILMSKHKMEGAYEKLTGHPLCDKGNLKQTLCIQCAQRLINFSRFRDKSLRARALMMGLVDKHELITRRHIKMINRTKHQLNSSMVLTTLGPDHCDLHILEHPSEDKQTESEEIELRDVVKTEESDDSKPVDGDMEVIHEEDNNVNDFVQDPLKYESVSFQCTLCLEEFFHEHAYMQHMCMHLQNGAGDGECDMSQVCKQFKLQQADPSPSARAAQTAVASLPASHVTNNEVKVPPTEEVDTNSRQYKRLTDCFVKLYDIFDKKVVQRQDVSLMKTQRDAMSCDSQNTVSEDFTYQATSQNVVPTTEYIESVTNSSTRVIVVVSKTLQSNTYCLKNVINLPSINSSLSSSQTEKTSFTCDVCQKNYNRKSLLVKHFKTHSEVKQFTCKICDHKIFKRESHFTQHMRTHTGEKPYSCELCDYKCGRRESLVIHMRTHTGEKPYSCVICEYKCSDKSNLRKHMITHTGDKPFTCKICNDKFACHSYLLKHMITHRGEKRFTCKTCSKKFTHNCNLVKHMITHTGEKQFSCKICSSKFSRNSHLVRHMRTHTGEKPFPCTICNSKYADKSYLVSHMRTHSDEKLLQCNLCEYKCVRKRELVRHTRTHTGANLSSCMLCEYKCRKNYLKIHMRTHTLEKLYSCAICEYKCSDKSNLNQHMRIHTGGKPFTCNICNSKFAQSSGLVHHMSTHIGVKPHSCELCEYKCAWKSSLDRHMRIHTGEKPYSCQICEYKCARKSNLVKHNIRIHTDNTLSV